MTINTVNLVGYAGQHPDVRYFENGKILCKFPVVVESGSANGETLLESIDLEIWNETAEIAAKYVPKGRLIGITGSLKFSSWLDRKTGQARSQPVILVDQIHLLGAKLDTQPLPASTQKGNQNSKSSSISNLLLSLSKLDTQPLPASTQKGNQNSESFARPGYRNSHQEYYDDYEHAEDPDQNYYSEYEEYEEYDTSMDYGYLDDMDNVYDHF